MVLSRAQAVLRPLRMLLLGRAMGLRQASESWRDVDRARAETGGTACRRQQAAAEEWARARRNHADIRVALQDQREAAPCDTTFTFQVSARGRGRRHARTVRVSMATAAAAARRDAQHRARCRREALRFERGLAVAPRILRSSGFWAACRERVEARKQFVSRLRMRALDEEQGVITEDEARRHRGRAACNRAAVQAMREAHHLSHAAF